MARNRYDVSRLHPDYPHRPLNDRGFAWIHAILFERKREALIHDFDRAQAIQDLDVKWGQLLQPAPPRREWLDRKAAEEHENQTERQA